MIDSVKHLPYESRLEQMKLWPLEERRIRADLIEVFKIVHGLSFVSFETFCEYSSFDRTNKTFIEIEQKKNKT